MLERETGFEPATSTLARSHSTAELLPLVFRFYSTCEFAANVPRPRYPHYAYLGSTHRHAALHSDDVARLSLLRLRYVRIVHGM